MPEERYFKTLLDLAKRKIEDDNVLDDYNDYELPANNSSNPQSTSKPITSNHERKNTQ